MKKMKIKLNWGLAVALFYFLFVVSVVVFIVIISGLKWDPVEDDPYNKGINYQSRIDKIARTDSLKEKPEVNCNGTEVIVKFPASFKNSTVHGNLTFFRSSDKQMDFIIPIKLDSNLSQSIDMTQKAKGFWLVKLDFISGGLSYYMEIEIIIP